MNSMFKTLSVAMAIVAAVMPLVGRGTQEPPQQNSTEKISDAPTYLPGEQTGAWFFPPMLYSIGEPALFEAAKNTSTNSYRLCLFSSVPLREIMVRLVINPNGDGQVISAVSAKGQSTDFERKTLPASAADIERLLLLLEKNEFWTMPSTEQRPSQPRVYELDGSLWLVEGARGGSFHYVFRQNPKSGKFRELAYELLGNLGKIDGFVGSAR